MGLAPEKASRIIVVLEDSHWTTTDPWTIGAGYSVRPVARAIKIKHAGLNPMVLGSVKKIQPVVANLE